MGFVDVSSEVEMSETVSWVNCPVRSCDAVASVIVCASANEDEDGRRQNEVMAALCKRASEVMFLE